MEDLIEIQFSPHGKGRRVKIVCIGHYNERKGYIHHRDPNRIWVKLDNDNDGPKWFRPRELELDYDT